ncbi:MAG: hypothetical protein NTW80_10695 [Deltaproteobacteria bacterium]|nr:hypothetical protein [Deltaproteobacteria bacterium]
MKKILTLTMLFVFIPMISGCIGLAVVAIKQKQIKDQKEQMQEVQSKVAATGSETFKQAEIKATIPRPLAEVYQATLLTSGADTSVNPSTPGRDRAQVDYKDTEPIYHNGKPIFGGGAADTGIMVTVYLESQGPNSTVVYFYPHNKLYEKIPPEQQQIVAANMQYRGRQFIYRLDTQSNSKQKWAWLRR